MKRKRESNVRREVYKNGSVTSQNQQPNLLLKIKRGGAKCGRRRIHGEQKR